MQGLVRELSGKAGAFSRALEKMVETASGSEVSLEHIRRCVLALERALAVAGFRGAAELERIWLGSLHLISEANGRGEGRAALDLFERFIDLRYTGQRLSVALEPETIALELESSLPQLGVSSGCVALLDDGDAEQLRPVLVVPTGKGSLSRISRIPRQSSFRTCSCRTSERRWC